MTLSDYLAIVRKRWILITVLIVIACSAAGYAAAAYTQPMYQASSKIIVNQATLENGKLQVNPGDVAVNNMLINTYKELIKTPGILQKVVQANPGLNVTVDELLGSLKISSAAGSQIMTVAWEDPSYVKASKIVNAVTSTFRVEAPGIMMTDGAMIVIPSDPETPSSPRQTGLTFILLVSFVASSIVAVFIAFLLETLDSGLKDAGKVEDWLGIPVLANIPVIRKSDIKNAKQAAAAPAFKRVGEDQHVHANG
ncbi:YveK family protein [Cohnella candidum]|uniref:Polysaccharide chain length determinant N-terminal domain-containing protein n=1 Tax=Cohnella candidum TaxID=2674991 RepID=A0A3G3K024_9BACL|nr:Wzz/FepE/Etk N-terminal domain-containing protein [Cohnella candidum]AYQ73848.1 hypothetical protein EAV92_15430 [Cohnella candidum]